jgi:hypothetical protein
VPVLDEDAACYTAGIHQVVPTTIANQRRGSRDGTLPRCGTALGCERRRGGYQAGMTDLYPAADDREILRRAAAAHTAAVQDVEAFLRRLPAVPDPAAVAEYANLLAREQQTSADRDAAADNAGLTVASMESDQG